MADVVVVGSVAEDLTMSVERLPTPGETLLAHATATAPGGKGSNQAIRAALAGASVAIVAAIGGDAAGEAARGAWAHYKVDATAAREVPDVPTGRALITVETTGENTIVVMRGANSALSPADVTRAAPLIASSRLVLGQLEVPLAATLSAFGLASSAGAATLLNLAPATPDLDPITLARTDLLILNETEAGIAAGLGPRSVVQSAAALAARGPRAVIVTLGAKGALLWRSGNEPLWVQAPAVTPVDTTGAGDAFVGAFAAAFVRGLQLPACVSEGVDAGSRACLHRGALPPRAQAVRPTF